MNRLFLPISFLHLPFFLLHKPSLLQQQTSWLLLRPRLAQLLPSRQLQAPRNRRGLFSP
jgi:hypothetical protein